MTIDVNPIISITDVNQNFSEATRIADKNGQAIVFKNNKPKYALVNLEENPQIEMTDKEKILFVGQRILHEHLEAFKELAK